MKGKTKIQLSSLEMKLATNAGWILTKNEIIQKARWQLESLQAKQEKYLKKYSRLFPDDVLKVSPKISKGENYKELPYLIMDYPRYFNKENIFAIRTMFWWGNFFSITLHLSGKYKKQFQQKIIASYLLLKKEECFICVSNTEWENHFEKNNFIQLKEISIAIFQNYIERKYFIKLAYKIPIRKWDNVQEFLMNKFKKMTEMLVG